MVLLDLRATPTRGVVTTPETTVAIGMTSVTARAYVDAARWASAAAGTLRLIFELQESPMGREAWRALCQCALVSPAVLKGRDGTPLDYVFLRTTCGLDRADRVDADQPTARQYVARDGVTYAQRALQPRLRAVVTTNVALGYMVTVEAIEDRPVSRHELGMLGLEG